MKLTLVAFVSFTAGTFFVSSTAYEVMHNHMKKQRQQIIAAMTTLASKGPPINGILVNNIPVRILWCSEDVPPKMMETGCE